MSTRAVYIFIDENESWPVYKHHDGYPTGAAEWISNALPHAWPLPRFEADEFACAFIAGNKQGVGSIRMTKGRDHHGDLDYAYEIRFDGKDLRVKCFETVYDGADKETFDGTLAEFKAWAGVVEAIDA